MYIMFKSQYFFSGESVELQVSRFCFTEINLSIISLILSLFLLLFYFQEDLDKAVMYYLKAIEIAKDKSR